ncbi:MAG: Lrp/AsnC family transcriptional regulator [archaeon GW2011_AR13]|nr:MAG: Lrp/AsnC family transcriptional regulator [archaeon GW2011_AR13]HIG94993.1 Lrp/AsnC family transcriptional regulator [Nanoarchaeota archaeon]HIH62895.1 Lrp/AsnC family transcriptional regulator [Nanoarchaeota archaeon]HIJ10312.1 Lrp/AsnC family transcriptional regulator [Nanoarchaeota archaeon]
MDSKDKKIINSLFDDARMSVAEIEKKTKIRRDSVARRLKKMINEKTILGFSPIINPSSLGYPNISLLLLKTKTGNDSQKEKFLNKLIQTKYIVHISKLIGKYDFYCAILYKDTKHLNEIIEKIKNYVPNYLEDFELYQVADDPKFEDMRGLL